MLKYILSTLILVQVAVISAQQIDTTYAPQFYSAGNGRLIAATGDGHLYVSGNFVAIDDHLTQSVARLAPDGAADKTFVFDPSIVKQTVEMMCVQPDGRLLLGGLFTSGRGDTLGRIIRLNLDGSYDSTFQLTVPGAYRELWGLVTTTDGRVVVGYDRGNSSHHPDARFIAQRYTVDGKLDSEFARIGLQTEAYYFVNYEPTVIDLRLDRSDRPVVAGPRLKCGERISSLYRFDTSGHVDTTFAPALNDQYSYLVDVAIGSDNRLAILTHESRLLVLDSTGTSSYAVDSIGRRYEYTVGYSSHPNVLLFTTDNSLVVIEYDDMRVYDATGKRTRYHTAFLGGIVAATLVDDLVCTAGYYRESRGYVGGGLLRIDPVTGVDITLTTALFSTGSISSVVPQSNGKIVAIGDFINVNRSEQRHLVRLDEGGATDATFANMQRTVTDNLNGGGIQLSNGRLVVGGVAGEYYGPVELLNPNGVPLNRHLPWYEDDESTLGPSVRQLAVDRQDRVYAGSNNSVHFPNSSRRTLMRYDFDGPNVRPAAENYADTKMAGGNSYYRFLLQPDGGLLLLTSISDPVDGSGQLSRLLPGGGYDPDFVPALPPGFSVTSAEILHDGAILLGGYTEHPSGDRDSAALSIIKLTADGSLIPDFDSAFRGATDFFGYRNIFFAHYPVIGNIVRVGDNVLLVHGNFNSYRGQPVRPPITIDAVTGDPVIGAIPRVRGYISNSLRTPQGELYLMGSFRTKWGGTSLLRITGLPKLVSTPQLQHLTPLSVFPNPHDGSSPLRANLPSPPQSAEVTYRIYGLTDGRLYSSGTIDGVDTRLTLPLHQTLSAGAYLLLVDDGKDGYVGRFLCH